MLHLIRKEAAAAVCALSVLFPSWSRSSLCKGLKWSAFLEILPYHTYYRDVFLS